MGLIRKYLSKVLARSETPFESKLKSAIARYNPDDRVSLQRVVRYLGEHGTRITGAEVNPDQRYAKLVVSGKKDKLKVLHESWRGKAETSLEDRTDNCVLIDNVVYKAKSVNYLTWSQGLARLEDGGLKIDINFNEK